MITNQELSKALRSLGGTTPDPLACLGCGHEHNCKRVGCALLREAAKRLNDMPLSNEPSGWISVNDGLPDAEQEVFILCNRNGFRFTTTAMYEDGTMSTEDSEWNWYDLDFKYDEENDKYLIPKGWWEYRHFNSDDVYNNAVDCEVTHWMPLPGRQIIIGGQK